MAKKKPYRYMVYLLARMTAALFFFLPRKILLKCAADLGFLAFYLVGRQRRKTLEHLRGVFKDDKSEAEIRFLGRRVFEHTARTAADFLQFPRLNLKKVESFVDSREAEGVYRALLEEGRGLISLTAHIGNWELLAGVFGLKGFRGGVLARRLYYEPYNRWVVGLRQSVLVPTIYRDSPPREVLQRLARNEIVGILPDQDIDSLPGIFVNFFGRPAYTIVAPAKLSLASRAPIVPNFLIRENGGRYKIVLGETIRPPRREERERAVQKMTREWMAACEQVIRQYPEQWAWMHDRWKTTPEKLHFKDKIPAVLRADQSQAEETGSRGLLAGSF